MEKKLVILTRVKWNNPSREEVHRIRVLCRLGEVILTSLRALKHLAGSIASNIQFSSCCADMCI